MWLRTTECYNTASERTLGKGERRDKTWISEETWKIIDQQKKLKERKANTSERLKTKLDKEYSDISKCHARKDKRDHTVRIVEEADRAVNRGELSKVYCIQVTTMQLKTAMATSKQQRGNNYRGGLSISNCSEL